MHFGGIGALQGVDQLRGLPGRRTNGDRRDLVPDPSDRAVESDGGLIGHARRGGQLLVTDARAGVRGRQLADEQDGKRNEERDGERERPRGREKPLAHYFRPLVT